MLTNAKLVIQIHLCDLVQVVVASVSGGQHVCCTGEWISAPDHHMVHMSASLFFLNDCNGTIYNESEFASVFYVANITS